MDIVALIHQRCKMEAFIFLAKLFKPFLQVFGYLGGGIVGLFVERQDNTVIFPHFGIGLSGVVRKKDVGYIPQINRFHPFYARIEQKKVLQFLQIGNFVAYPNQIVNAVFRYVAGRHGKILCG